MAYKILLLCLSYWWTVAMFYLCRYIPKVSFNRCFLESFLVYWSLSFDSPVFFFILLFVYFIKLDTKSYQPMVTGTEFRSNVHVTDKAFFCRKDNI